MDKTRTLAQKWLANELDLQFLIIKECTKFQSNRFNSFKSYRIYRQTRRGDLMKNGGGGGGQILQKSITFSDENVKRQKILILES